MAKKMSPKTPTGRTKDTVQNYTVSPKSYQPKWARSDLFKYLSAIGMFHMKAIAKQYEKN